MRGVKKMFSPICSEKMYLVWWYKIGKNKRNPAVQRPAISSLDR